MQYLKGTSGREILFEQNESVGFEAYRNSDYARSTMDSKSTTRYYTFMGGNLVTWKRKNKV